MKRVDKKAFLAIPLSTMLVLAACGGENTNDAENDPNNMNETTENAPEEGENNNETAMDEEGAVDADPDEPIAIVNGEEIPMEELQMQMSQYEMLFAQQGMDPEDEENAAMIQELQQDILDLLVNQELLNQEADAQNIEVSDEEVEEELDQMREQFEEEEEFEQALEMQNYTLEQLEDDIRQMKRVQELQTMAHLDEDQYTVSEDEAREYYEEIVMSNPEIGEFEDIQEDIENELKLDLYLDDLREQAEIEILI
ncbi:SurA N-terminal domain-containing protein [Salipaludibacillus agaradhaerens]|uniref:SurA N-terminal domain-containing protein n=1 Tax=Salipaludibacillus agaradhaerens TaxID=76935 RepID=A0A9Q4FZA2_SALAG|nr:SurA N-terminal domain-containing protein [Salipaludibacillus agaradhaerens]MCR6096559.1 SurA N-terminal domain-containing protein [Salipaludibacillus agaradhaerens]MCR6113882.1 SurA N-terminal domain-containing protein [Salipaludibacillus agaradhaerens]